MNRFFSILLALTLATLTAKSQDTFSIVALDTITGEVGSAGASCVDLANFPGFTDHFLGELFPGVGAINTQASYNATNQANARNRMNMGETPSQIIQWLVANDISFQPGIRQYGIVAFVNGAPESAAHTGTSCIDYKSHVTGPNYSIQGNILSGQAILDSMEARFLAAEGDLACKLMAALQGANEVGADTRCGPNGTSSLFAFVKVSQPGDTFGNPSFVLSVRTKNNQGIEPVDSLQTLFDAAHTCMASGTEDQGSLHRQFSIYPNPASKLVTVESKIPGTFALEINDVQGNRVYQTTLTDKTMLDTTGFEKGVYWVRLSDGRRAFVSKLVIP